jgi:hypothetical protein
MNHIPTHMLINELVKRFNDYTDYGVDDFACTAAQYDEVLLVDVHRGLETLQHAYVETVLARVLESLGQQGDE